MTGTYVGDCDRVLGLLRDCYFPTREGVANFHDIYVDAVLTAGVAKAGKGDYAAAAGLMQKAFEYPENHQVFLYDTRTPRDAQIYAMIAGVWGGGRLRQGGGKLPQGGGGECQKN